MTAQTGSRPHIRRAEIPTFNLLPLFVIGGLVLLFVAAATLAYLTA